MEFDLMAWVCRWGGCPYIYDVAGSPDLESVSGPACWMKVVARWKISRVTALPLKKGKVTGDTSQGLLVNEEVLYPQVVTKTAAKDLHKLKD